MFWKRSGADCIFSAFLLICIELGLFFCLYDVTGFDDAKIIFRDLIPLIIPFAVLCSFLFYSRKSIYIGIPAMILFLSFFLGIYREPLLVWLEHTASRAVLAVNDYYGLKLETLVSPEKFSIKSFQKGNTAVCLFVAFLLSLDVAGFQKAVRIGVLSSCIVIFGTCVGKIPSGFALLLLFTGLLGLAATGKRTSDFHKKWKCGKKTVVKITCEEREEEKEALFHGGQMASAVTLCCFLAALGISSIFGKQAGSGLLELHTPLQKQINMLEYQMLHYDYSRFLGKAFEYFNLGNTGRNQQKGTLGNDRVTHTGEEILQITVEKKPMEAMYLRGFIGKDYQGSSWSEAEESDFSSSVQKWGLGDEESTGLAVQNFAFTKISSQFDAPSEIEINYSSQAGTYAYLPYLSKAGGSLTVRGDGAVFRTAEKKNSLVKTLYTEGFSKYTLNYYQSAVQKKEVSPENTALEKKYRKYAKQEYLKVPANLKKLKKACRKNIHAQNLWTITTTIREYLHDNAEYSLELDPLPAGEDFTEYFLYTQKQGYCIHFATAAVLMYRICKIPARFVEGYIIWPEDFKQNSDGTYTAVVTDERAHAWTEIYYDGFGFMPVDMTPGAAVKEQMMAAGTSAKKETISGEDEKEENDTLEDTEEDKDSGKSWFLEEETEEQKEEEEKTGTEEEEKALDEDAGKETAGDENTGNENTGEEDTGNGSDGDETARKEALETDGGNNGTMTAYGTEEEKSAEIENSAEDDILETVRENTALLNLKTVGKAILCLVAMFVLLTAGKLVYYKRRYRKEWKRQSRSFSDRRRREVIKLSCKLYESMELSGYEKKWRKKCKGSLTDREYEVMIRKEFSFLNDEYGEFQKLVQKARFASPEAENIISETEFAQCRKFVRLILDALMEKTGWYKRLLLRLLFPPEGMEKE